MEFSSVIDGKRSEIIDLFATTFAASEGGAEGARIGTLVKDLVDTTAAKDLLIFTAWNGADLIGGICFSYFRLHGDDRIAFLLSPVAVRPTSQRQGVGQALLNYGLSALRDLKVDLVITYGDPKYYCQVGFEQITVDTIPSPHALSQPEGWLAQSLTDDAILATHGATYCVKAFNNPAYW